MATEKRLIDADALKAIFDKRYDTAFMQERTRANMEWWNGYATGVNWGRNTITDVPTVDAVEVVHGRWIYSDEFGDLLCYECDKCGTLNDYESNYCPECGAKMYGGKDDGR